MEQGQTPKMDFRKPSIQVVLRILPESLPDNPVACWKTYKKLLTKAAWQTMNNHNNTQQDTLSALLKLQKASVTEALTIIERNKEGSCSLVISPAESS
ncbi:hypothetical protein Pelo_18967 [Pelomyxa schiedti]|nr:hypothetical protein Pelo_18967 [Pelomyxa schiedti]